MPPATTLPVPKYGDITTDTLGRQGTAMFNPNTGVALKPIPTVMTDANVREGVIPGINQKTNSLVSSGTPVASLTTGNNTSTSTGADSSSVATGQDMSATSDYASILEQYGLKGTDSTSIEDAVASDPYLATARDLTTKLLASTDAQTSSYVKSIQDQYLQKENNLKQQQNAQNGALTQSLLLGNSFGAPASTAGIQEAKTAYDLQTINDLQNEENNLIQTALTAQKTGNYKALMALNDQIEKKRGEKQDLAAKVNQALIDQNNKVKAAKIQSSRDNAVADLISQGVTDPVKILDYLNKDDNGNVTGDFTVAEVSKTMKAIADSNGSSVDKLSSDMRDFFILQKEHPEVIPANITSLPPNQQLAAWLNYVKPKKVAGVGKVNPITLSEAKTAGLPYSVIGQSQSEVEQSFNSNTPPSWFIEKIQGEQKQSLNPEAIQNQWSTYRNEYLDKFNNPQTTQEKTAAATEDVNHQKAKTYFTSEFDGLDDDTLNSLADSVNQYIGGGMSYAKAVAQVEKDAGQ